MNIDGDQASHGQTNFSDRTRDELELLRARFQTVDVLQRVWHEVLTEEEKMRLGGDLEKLWNAKKNTVQVAMEAWNCSALQALISRCV